MKIVEIVTLENGAHRNQTCNFLPSIPDGWAVIPDGMELENFPFGTVEAEEIGGVMTLTRWTAGELPPEPPTPEPSEQDDVDAMLIDHELRLSLLELGGDM